MATLATGGGIVGDAHATTERPLSLLPLESFGKISHPDLEIRPGDFAENITTLGLDFSKIGVGSKLRLGESAEIEVIQTGKRCDHGCVIRTTVGDCIMPREGVFARVLAGGDIREGDPIRLVEP